MEQSSWKGIRFITRILTWKRRKLHVQTFYSLSLSLCLTSYSFSWLHLIFTRILLSFFSDLTCCCFQFHFECDEMKELRFSYFIFFPWYFFFLFDSSSWFRTTFLLVVLYSVLPSFPSISASCLESRVKAFFAINLDMFLLPLQWLQHSLFSFSLIPSDFYTVPFSSFFGLLAPSFQSHLKNPSNSAAHSLP